MRTADVASPASRTSGNPTKPPPQKEKRKERKHKETKK
jgi:hypothetical protein